MIVSSVEGETVADCGRQLLVSEPLVPKWQGSAPAQCASMQKMVEGANV